MIIHNVYIKESEQSEWYFCEYLNTTTMVAYDTDHGREVNHTMVGDAFDLHFEQPDTDVIRCSWAKNML